MPRHARGGLDHRTRKHVPRVVVRPTLARRERRWQACDRRHQLRRRHEQRRGRRPEPGCVGVRHHPVGVIKQPENGYVRAVREVGQEARQRVVEGYLSLGNKVQDAHRHDLLPHRRDREAVRRREGHVQFDACEASRTLVEDLVAACHQDRQPRCIVAQAVLVKQAVGVRGDIRRTRQRGGHRRPSPATWLLCLATGRV